MIILVKKKQKEKYVPADFEDSPSLSEISGDLLSEIEDAIDDRLDDVQYFVENIEIAVENLEVALAEGDTQMMTIIIDRLKIALNDFLACDECELEVEGE